MTALVTGGGGGIGRVACIEFARAGYRVAVCDRKAEQAEETVAAVRELGGEAFAYTVDIGDGPQVQKMIGSLRESFGRIDAAFNNAGMPALRVPLADVDEADWDRVVRTNLTGTFLCMKYEILAMLEQGGGCIVNNSSVFGVGGGMSAPYTATKHGICGLTKSAAIAYAEQGVRINAVCPGLIEAGMGLRVLARPHPDPRTVIATSPINRTGAAEEVAKAVVWLCSTSASYIHGHMLAVDGGYGARG
ncbi:SDR family oxidoreductase [Solimonas sp. K1W22B-7]|nr:SDR family oxidoreductase [Solimonas sp. K1W22B-7]